MALSMHVPNGEALALSGADSGADSGAGSGAGSGADQDIILEYLEYDTTDPRKHAVKVTPKTVDKPKTICFKGAYGWKVRVIFVSPFGDELLEMNDSETRALSVGGIYPFKCFFTPDGGGEIEAGLLDGGILDVGPTRP